MSSCKTCARPIGLHCQEATGGKACQYHEPKNRTSKYNATEVKADGYIFDSIAEYQRYLVLRDRERVGEITKLDVHPVLVLFPASRDLLRLKAAGLKVAAISYEADFSYLEAEHCIWEDVKGKDTSLSAMKRRIALERLPDLDLRVVWVGRGRRDAVQRSI